MAPGPRGPHGGGFGPGGPHGGFGGPRGGFGGPRGGFGPRGGRKPAPTEIGNNSSGSSLLSDKIFDAVTGANKRKAFLKSKFGKKATIIGLKLSTTGAFKEDLFKSRVKTADDLLSNKRITLAEAKKRKMEAATSYYGYLKEIEYLTQEEYNNEMQDFAQSIGVTYTPAAPAPAVGRTR